MRIILDGSVSTVKRLRISLGTLVAIEATVAPTGRAHRPAAFIGPAAAAVPAALASPAQPAPANRTASANVAPDPTTAVETIIETANVAPDSTTHVETIIETANIAPSPTAAAESAIEAAFAAIARVNCLMHPHAEGSHLARINSAPLHQPVEVHPSVGKLLTLARRINTLTDGVFDPCLPTQPGRLSDVEVSETETVVVCHAPVALDFGGFAKGYAVDCAIEALMAAGCTAGLVNAGGDMRVFGPREEPLFVRGPAGELINIELADAALAVSDVSAQQRPGEHQGYYERGRDTAAHADQHAAILAPASSYVAVIASTAVVADALTKCVLFCESRVTERVLKEFNAREAFQ
jgi:thiamine biosynthesis lipoprotein